MHALRECFANSRYEGEASGVSQNSLLQATAECGTLAPVAEEHPPTSCALGRFNVFRQYRMLGGIE